MQKISAINGQEAKAGRKPKPYPGFSDSLIYVGKSPLAKETQGYKVDASFMKTLCANSQTGLESLYNGVKQ